MLEKTGNIWTDHNAGKWIVITTNGTIKKDGSAVMGRGVASEANIIFGDISKKLGGSLKTFGNTVFCFDEYKLFTFPVKHQWSDIADIKLIEESIKELVDIVNHLNINEIYMVRPGCGNGQLEWKNVKSVIEKYLDDRFIIVQKSLQRRKR